MRPYDADGLKVNDKSISGSTQIFIDNEVFQLFDRTDKGIMWFVCIVLFITLISSWK